MSVGGALLEEIWDDGTLFLLAGLLVVVLLARFAVPQYRRRLVWLLSALGLHLLLVPVAGLLRGLESPLYLGVRLATLIPAAIAGLGMASIVLFGVLLARAGLRVPAILQDVIVGLGAIIVCLVLAAKLGFDITGVVATSAILTAVVALSLQDTLGNIVGGLALQMDKTVAPGDWIKFDDVSGRVVEIRWRSTALETRNWETLIVPNSALVKGSVLVLGRRGEQPIQWRRWVYFNVDFRFAPNEVIDAVTQAVRGAPIEAMASNPPPNCILMDLTDSYGRYAVRYWLADLAVDDPTDSLIRTLIYAGLRRVGIPLSIPAHAVFLTKESEGRKTAKEHEGLERRVAALSKVDVFGGLSGDELTSLAEGMRYAPFARGEVLTRQGAEAHWLYMVIEGEVAVEVSVPGGEAREVARLGPGSFFGEAALLTGEPRAASVVALTDVECYRLGKAEFQQVVRHRPELARDVAEILAQRNVELKAVRDSLGREGQTTRLDAARSVILTKLRRVLGLADLDG